MIRAFCLALLYASTPAHADVALAASATFEIGPCEDEAICGSSVLESEALDMAYRSILRAQSYALLCVIHEPEYLERVSQLFDEFELFVTQYFGAERMADFADVRIGEILEVECHPVNAVGTINGAIRDVEQRFSREIDGRSAYTPNDPSVLASMGCDSPYCVQFCRSRYPESDFC